MGFSILRPSACFVPVIKRKALRFNQIFLRTEVATPPIVVLQPTASVTGNIITPRIAVLEGGKVTGEVRIQDQPDAEGQRGG